MSATPLLTPINAAPPTLEGRSSPEGSPTFGARTRDRHRGGHGHESVEEEEVDEDNGADDGDDEGGVTDARGGAYSEPEPDRIGMSDGALPVTEESTRGGYMSAESRGERGSRALPATRLPRSSQLASRPLTFGGQSRGHPRRHLAAPAPRSTQTRRAASATRSSHGAVARSADEEDERHNTSDPLAWTGGSPPPVPPLSTSAFGGLPPLLAEMVERMPSGGAVANGQPAHLPATVLRCSSYCCALGLDLVKLYRTLTESWGLPCRMHKDGLNAMLHCHETNGRDGDAHTFFFSYGWCEPPARPLTAPCSARRPRAPWDSFTHAHSSTSRSPPRACTHTDSDAALC